MGNWINVVPPVYRKGRLIEMYSSDCVLVRWNQLDPTIDFICDDCGQLPQQHRWINLDPATDYYCSDIRKLYKQQLQESFDSGVTWVNVVPPVYRRGNLAEYKSEDCGYIPQQYFSLYAKDNDFTVNFEYAGSALKHLLFYSLDNGNTWLKMRNHTESLNVYQGQRVLFKAQYGLEGMYDYTISDLYGRNGGIGTFIISPRGGSGVSVEGNIMSLLYGDDFEDKTDLSGLPYIFSDLFGTRTFEALDASGVSYADKLVLPATTLAPYCYYKMFTNLHTLPELPATTLASHCYDSMFTCSASKEGLYINLPATTLAPHCYDSMFLIGNGGSTLEPGFARVTIGTSATTMEEYSCLNMFQNSTANIIAELPSTTLAPYCYSGMFKYCERLVTLPDLPSTMLAEGCYEHMFRGCSGLTSMPSGLLPATTLAEGCYAGMFSNCTSLTNVPSDLLPATTLAENCYNGMFSGCSGLTASPNLYAEIVPSGAYAYMFNGCKRLHEITCMTKSGHYYSQLENWVYGVASTGTFYKNALSSNWSIGKDGIPSGWTVINVSGQYRTIYGEPYCVGYDKYETMYSQVSYDSGATWQTTATTEQVIEHDSADCGYIPPEPQFRTISGETYCSGSTGCDKYVDVYFQHSYDGGVTWETETITPTLVEANSADCGYAERTISGTPYCDGYSKKVEVYSQISYDSGNTWSTTASTTTLVEEKSYDCGYRERTTSGTPYCDGYAKKVEVYSQVSYDSGTTWNTTATSVSTIELYSEDCGYIPPTGTSQYLTFIAQDNGTFTFNGTSGGDIVNDTIYYSLDSGSTWSTLASGATSPTINSGNKIMWKGELQSYGGIGTFSSSGRYSVEGNAMSLLYGDNFIGQTTIESTGALEYLFQGSTGLTSVEHMVLPATSLLRACYYGMFSGCTALTTAMEILPCTRTIPQSAYANMFYGCASLTRAPELPGKLGSSSSSKNSYNRMFYGCSSLNYIKCLTTIVPSDDYGYPSCTGSWVYGVAATGTFVKNASTTWPTGTKWVNGSIPDGWAVIDAT